MKDFWQFWNEKRQLEYSLDQSEQNQKKWGIVAERSKVYNEKALVYINSTFWEDDIF